MNGYALVCGVRGVVGRARCFHYGSAGEFLDKFRPLLEIIPPWKSRGDNLKRMLEGAIDLCVCNNI
jgi:hypothetical protein